MTSGSPGPAVRLTHALRRAARLDVLRHGLGNPLFDARWYLDQYRDVADAGGNPYRHYRRHGAHEGRDPNPLFDTDWYLDRYPDVRASGINPLDHYLDHGTADGRDPGPLFDTSWYAEQNPDVAASRMNPLLHYLRRGGREGWLPRPGGWVPRDLGWLGSDEVAPSGQAGGQAGGRRVKVPDKRLAAWLTAQLPADSAGDARLLLLDPGRIAAPQLASLRTSVFPGPTGNRRSGAGTALIAQLEVERMAGAEYIVLTPIGRDWAGQRPAFVAHLEDRYRSLAHDDEIGDLLDLRRLLAPDEAPLAARLRALVAEFRAATGGPPVILDWTMRHLARTIDAAQVFEPPTGGAELPYLDHSIDVVVVERDGALEEARRVAGAVLVIGRPGDRQASPSIERLMFPARRALPSASIVIPNFNGLSLLRACLRSVSETVTLGAGCEVIVVDDASDDGTQATVAELVAGLRGARVIVSATNSGFLASANRGVAAARGDYVVLLNNDTVVLPGWLDELLITFQTRPDAGVVGGRLLYPDGRLQEAGGLVFSDGSAAKLGAGDDDPDQAQYMFLREADYVSGAVLATQRALFEQLGAFDPEYGFGFYEDTDYCFRVRQAGRSVLYQPRCVVVHLEGATAGRDLAVGPKRHQALNQERFRARWQATLGQQPELTRLDEPIERLAAALNPPSPLAGS